jgi:DNA-binding NarL/FixJ family response regulator
MPPDLVQRLVSTALRVGPESAQPAPEGFDKLTAREYEVALEVGYGANNKEIAEKLAVSERTVKAHLTSIFEKLALRDRVQLALAVNRLPIH